MVHLGNLWVLTSLPVTFCPTLKWEWAFVTEKVWVWAATPRWVKWVWRAAAKELSSPGQNKHLALWPRRGPVFTDVTAHPDVEAGLFSSYSGSENLPWHVSTGCCPRPANSRMEGNTQEGRWGGKGALWRWNMWCVMLFSVSMLW